MITDYNDLTNKPTINGVTLTSNMTLEDIGIKELTADMVLNIVSESFGAIL